jgi:hypothetical protein
LCELAELEGTVRALAADPTGVFVCADLGASARLARVSTAAAVVEIATVNGNCRGVTVEPPFVYFGIGHDDSGGVYRADLTGAGFHLEVEMPKLAAFTVHGGLVSVTASGHSTPLSEHDGWRVPMSAFRQDRAEAGPLTSLADGRLLWGVASTRELLLTAPDGNDGDAVYNGAGAADAAPHSPFLVAADAAGAVIIDGDALYAVPTDATRAPEPRAAGLRSPVAIALRGSDVVVAEADRVMSYARDSVEPPRQLAAAQAAAVATLGDRVFIGRGSGVSELRQDPATNLVNVPQ